jgi:hypothetical protein
MQKAFIFALFSLAFIVCPAFAQTSTQVPKTDEILAAARQQLAKGEACLAAGNVECARREFDAAVDYVFDQGVDVRSDPKLQAGLREIVEKIYAYETRPAAENVARLWKAQDYDGRPDPDKQEVAESSWSGGPMSVGEFQRRFAVLRDAFHEKYNRDITLSGADHEEHRRLYGVGSAYDIRVRDLTREQVTYIIAKGNELGLRIKDFSTWERVAAHNSRSAQLGRPADTYATGIHLHIDRMGAPRASKMIETPAISKPHLPTEDSKKN